MTWVPPVAPTGTVATDEIVSSEGGSVLAFLPGAAEIRRAEALLKERMRDPALDIVPLYGALDADTQDRAIAPAPPGQRKVVLATSIAKARSRFMACASSWTAGSRGCRATSPA